MLNGREITESIDLGAGLQRQGYNPPRLCHLAPGMLGALPPAGTRDSGGWLSVPNDNTSKTYPESDIKLASSSQPTTGLRWMGLPQRQHTGSNGGANTCNWWELHWLGHQSPQLEGHPVKDRMLLWGHHCQLHLDWGDPGESAEHQTFLVSGWVTKDWKYFNLS